MWCGKEGSPYFPVGVWQDDELRSSRGHCRGIRTRQPPEPPLVAASPAALGGWGLWVTVELNAWFSEGFGGLLPGIS